MGIIMNILQLTKNHKPVNNHFVHFGKASTGESVTILQSYTSNICMLFESNTGQKRLLINGDKVDYSPTTKKYYNHFVKTFNAENIPLYMHGEKTFEAIREGYKIH